MKKQHETAVEAKPEEVAAVSDVDAEAPAKLDDDPVAAIHDLFERVGALETQLAALQRATAHITSIQPIKG